MKKISITYGFEIFALYGIYNISDNNYVYCVFAYMLFGFYHLIKSRESHIGIFWHLSVYLFGLFFLLIVYDVRFKKDKDIVISAEKTNETALIEFYYSINRILLMNYLNTKDAYYDGKI